MRTDSEDRLKGRDRSVRSESIKGFGKVSRVMIEAELNLLVSGTYALQRSWDGERHLIA